MIEVWVLVLLAFSAWMFDLLKKLGHSMTQPLPPDFKSHYLELKFSRKDYQPVFLKDYAGQIRYARDLYFKIKEEFYVQHPIGSHYSFVICDKMGHFVIENEDDQFRAFELEYRDSSYETSSREGRSTEYPWRYCVYASRIDAIKRGYAPDNCSGFLRKEYSPDMKYISYGPGFPRDWRAPAMCLNPKPWRLFLDKKELDIQEQRLYNELLDYWDQQSEKINETTKHLLRIGYISR